ncbi:MAG: TIGR03013 family XrtA/PEP-CTERM system glycosyltransferase [Pseudomonadales bacterium]|jgi:sugar transferase (PEP-CTERM system associated)|nr:TIGR03013 family XrtA/PEP-CTERM system glycosyltransferase [Pseudomonadales bacterium]
MAGPVRIEDGEAEGRANHGELSSRTQSVRAASAGDSSTVGEARVVRLPARGTASRLRLTHLRVFGHRVRSTQFIQFASDFVGLCLLAAFVLPAPTSGELFPALAAAIASQLGLLASGHYEHREREGFSGMALRALIGTAVVAPLGLLAVDLLLPGDRATASALVLFGLFAALLALVSRTLLARWRGAPVFRRRVLVLGVGREAARIDARMRRHSDRMGFEIVGYVTLGERDEIGDDGLTARHDLRQQGLLELCTSLDVDEIVIAQDDRRGGATGSMPIQALLECRMHGVNTIELPEFVEREAGRIDVDALRPSWLLFSEGFARPAQLGLKRVFDVCVSCIMLMLSWPLVLLVGLAIKVEEGIRAPVFYRQQRIGLHGRPFMLLKFRSMRTDAEGAGEARFAEHDDARATGVGRVLRRLRVDELPQLVNVLRGQMSMVGPRPERPCFVSRFTEEVPFYSERHRIKPGLTGWAQLNYPYGTTSRDAQGKLEFDLYYVKNQSLLLDLLILIRTLEVVLLGRPFGERRERVPHGVIERRR